MSNDDLTLLPGMHLGQKLARYKAWANRRTIGHLLGLPEGQVTKPRNTYFGSVLHSLQHSYIVDDIFRAHLEGRPHGYSARRSDDVPSLGAFWRQTQVMDQWWIAHADAMSEAALHEGVDFTFIGGDAGRMTRLEIIMHVANHTSYHRGYVDQLMGEDRVDMPSCDFPVFLREMSAQSVAHA